ncbi:succinylglutamate desuccinylase [Desulfobacca acetoxidans]|nr:succinylglutamate desuccinylase [Desulfobacterales bacterium]
MKKSRLIVVMVGVLVLGAFVTGALAQGKLLCISPYKSHRGESTVDQCLAKGDEFAIVDQYGVVHILSKREVELTKAFNPQIFQQKAFSIKYQELAPEVKLFGTTVKTSQPKPSSQ